MFYMPFCEVGVLFASDLWVLSKDSIKGNDVVNKALRLLGAMGVTMMVSTSVMAVPMAADLDVVTGNLASGYVIDVPGLGSLSLTYGSPTTSYDGYSDTSTFFAAGGSNFVLGAGNSLTISGVDFVLDSAIFELWDLDTVNLTETATFTDGSVLTGVNYNILNSSASTTDTQSSALIAAVGGSISIEAGPSGAAAFGIGGISVNPEAAPVPAPATLALLAAGLIVMRRFVAGKVSKR
tara:strand:- start:44386 stop:45096 length:711 start_codon:yes stop_codon:yes gene_type:complete